MGLEDLNRQLERGTVVAPTAYDMVAARVIEESGFPAVFCSGYGQAASALGRADDGSLTLGVAVQRAQAMASAVRIPVIVDADTGFGDPAQAAQELGGSGAAAMMIEDQIPAKRCGHVPGKAVVTVDEMLARIDAAAASRPAGFLIVARTDAAEAHGLEAALDRGRRYADAGADVVFVEAPQSIEALTAIPPALPCPAMANIVRGGRTPELSVAELEALGFRLIVFGLLDLMLATAALREGLGQLAATGDVRRLTTPCLTFVALNELTGMTRPPSQR